MKAPPREFSLWLILLVAVALAFGAVGWLTAVAAGGGRRPLAGA
jgi:hypothetical protein